MVWRYYTTTKRNPNQAAQYVSSDTLFQSAYLNFQRGHMDAAAGECQALLATDPRHVSGLQLLAHLRFMSNAFDEAVALLKRASIAQPENPVILSNLGAACCAAGRFDEAIDPLRTALQLDPKLADGWKNLGRALQKTGRSVDAEIAYRNAVALNPADAELLNELAGVYSELGQLDEAIATLQRALQIRPRFPEALNNLAASMQETGRLDESIHFYRQSLAVRADQRVHANLIMALHLVDDELMSAQREIERWNNVYTKPLKRDSSNFQNDRSPDRRLRIGYVSRDFNISPVGRFIAPILSHHNHQSFEVFAYADTLADDRVVQQNKTSADHWRPTLAMNDEELARQIRDDQIDVLIDLGMHTKSSRIFVFARKPAPVQISYLAYAGSTGLAEIDAEVSDGFLNPAGAANVQSFWCYQAPAEAPEAARRSGPITFGCLNNFCKVTPAIRAAWLEIINRVPEARLILHVPPGSHREKFPVDQKRVTFVDRQSSAQYFALYNSIDIALDTFPYPGGTTTCDALWMGTPVVSVAGNTPVSRAGLSILSNAGVPELCAKNRIAYVEIAVSLAQDRSRLDELHRTLRDRMRRSPLMDAARAARDMEAVFRKLWRQFCSRGSV
jgi:protein O-GlcNAc transferase